MPEESSVITLETRRVLLVKLKSSLTQTNRDDVVKAVKREISNVFASHGQDPFLQVHLAGILGKPAKEYKNLGVDNKLSTIGFSDIETRDLLTQLSTATWNRATLERAAVRKDTSATRDAARIAKIIERLYAELIILKASNLIEKPSDAKKIEKEKEELIESNYSRLVETGEFGSVLKLL